jgi:hypothetical protein
MIHANSCPSSVVQASSRGNSPHLYEIRKDRNGLSVASEAMLRNLTVGLRITSSSALVIICAAAATPIP